MSETRARQKRFEILCMKALDDILENGEKKEFEALTHESLEYKQEYEAMKKIREITKTMEFSTPSDAIWDKYWTGIYNRIERGIGWLIFTLGAVILCTWGAFRFIESIISDDHVTVVVKIGVLLFSLGLSILVVSVVRERCFIKKRDPYREIKR
ncbi:hypothetical protein JW835_13340 [bacterium]|nr:hypothetical protein [bacterium]